MADENLMKMQQEAAERVRQMQARARRFTSDEPAKESPPATTGIAHRTARPPVAKHGGTVLSSLGINADQDQLLLLLLAVVMAKNDAPIELLLALLYIAM